MLVQTGGRGPGWERCAHSKQDPGQLLPSPHPSARARERGAMVVWRPGRRLWRARTPDQRLSQPGSLGTVWGHWVTVDQQLSSILMVTQAPCGSCLLADSLRPDQLKHLAPS